MEKAITAMARVGYCPKCKAVEWWDCYTICTTCKRPLFYEHVEQVERATGKQRPARWPEGRINKGEAAAAPPRPQQELPDLVRHLTRQRAWSEQTFGPGSRAAGVVDHIRKELREIEADPADLSEWVDVIILACDGAWRAGHSPEQIASAIVAKQTRNEGRQWPDWRTAPPDKAIEHVKAAPPRPEAPPQDDKGPHIRAVEYAREQIVPLYRNGEEGTPYERGMVRQVAAHFLAGWFAAKPPDEHAEDLALHGNGAVTGESWQPALRASPTLPEADRLRALAWSIANRICASTSGKDHVRAIAESLLAWPNETPTVKMLAESSALRGAGSPEDDRNRKS